MEKPPPDPADHAEDFARRWADRLDQLVAIRMDELGIPAALNGAPDFEGRSGWRAFNPGGRTGGHITSGITLNSGVFNPDLLKGGKGGRIWQRARLRDRIDAIIAHEWEENRTGGHLTSLKAAPKTGLAITEGARRILRAMAR